jgi:tRNA nucleotidyltransferase (CCA-adding enzyme)
VARGAPAAQARLAARLGLPPRPLADLAQIEARATELSTASPAGATALLRPLDPRSLTLARCLAPAPLAAALAHYQDTWQHVKPLVTGDDLHALGLPRGPRYRVLLDALRDARLDGRVTTREDELALVRKLMRNA